MSPAPLRIVHIVRAPIGGIFRHISDLALAQTRDGHHVGVVCDASSGGAFEDRAIADLAPRLALGVRRFAMRRAVGPGDLFAAFGIYRQIRELKPDILHGHGAKGGFFARAVGTMFRLRGHKVTRIYCPHGGSLHFDPTRWDGRIYFLLERLQQVVTDGIVFVSDYENAAYEAKVATPKVPARVVYNGLAPHEFAPVEVDGDAADFLFIGMLRDLKGPDLFIRALHNLTLAHGLTPTATIAGEGEERAKYERMVADFGLESRVRFAGSLPAREAFRKARCVVVPSRAEAMPYIVLEAVAAEMPLIATRVGGVPEIFGRFADRLVEPGDPAALTAAMVAACVEPEKMRRFAVTLRKGLAESFNIDLMNDRITSLYLGVRNGSPAGLPPAGAGSIPHLTPSEMLARTGEAPSSRQFD
ncbi:glycosyltransferase [Rhizobiales bacterium]|uniref:glycosyltransferase n=1 Tax=Hongsoonwoonella zoysiae TaxID=2821844 RepID=UPI00155FC6EA|nr:glycosyltransferase [Hongsoonwoonella zoysiae]NRG18433.1 glycosyltransferase [Hongsoonwoonella zoysiae]